MSEIDGMEFDEVLATAMQPVEAPEGFAERLMTRAAAVEAVVRPKSRVLMFPAPRAWRSGAIAAVLVMGCALGGLHVKHMHEAAQQTAEFELSLQITNQALAQTRQQLQKAGVSLDQD
jgi:hypothetical protein